MTGRFDAAIAAVDAANEADPNRIVHDGRERPKEIVHAALMTQWVQRLDPDATDVQLLAARAHHLRRWVLPRSDFAPGRAGYLRWRKHQGVRQANEIAEILLDYGYDAATAAEVGAIIRKAAPDGDPVGQVHEDALCLVFVELQLDDLVGRLGTGKADRAIARTVAKMSDAAVDLALQVASPIGRRALDTAAGSR